MLKIRLKRVGRRNDPSFRVVVTESARGPKSNRAVEQVGFYNPKTKERTLDGERIAYWMENGAQVSDTVYNMFVDTKVIEGKKKNVLPQKSPVVKEQAEESKNAEAPAETTEEQPTVAEQDKDTAQEAKAEEPTAAEEEAAPEETAQAEEEKKSE